MKIHVLGTGPSLKKFLNNPPKNCVTVGVNDIWKHYPADYVVCVDKPHRFTPDRLGVICNGKQKEFICPYEEWNGFVYNFKSLPFSSSGRGGTAQLDDHSVLTYSTNSAYSAIVKAYHLGAIEIILYGVDFIGHHALKDNLAKVSIRHIAELRIVLKIKGCDLYIGSDETALAGIIPLYKR